MEGLKVSELCFGAMTIGTKNANAWGMSTATEEESIALLNRFKQVGGNFIDTANIYGDSELVLGRWLATQQREDWVIATKVAIPVGTAPNDGGLGRKHIKASIDRSLQRLQTSYIDIYQAHSWDPTTPLQETLRTFDELVRSGKVHYIGLSNFNGWQLQKAIDLTQQLNLAPIVSLQPQYHLLCRSTEWELLPVCKNEGLAVLPWSPLAGGWLAGRYKKAQPLPEGTRAAWSEKVGWKATSSTHLANESTWRVVETVEKIAQETGHSMAQVSLRWLMQNPTVTSIPIIGAKNLEQLNDNLGAAQLVLSEQQMKQLNDSSAESPPYPWGDKYLSRL